MIPKTNLFKGDVVQYSKSYINTQQVVGRLGFAKHKDRIGVIETDTLKPTNHNIKVRWKGNRKANACDLYMPDDLVLYEGSEQMDDVIKERKHGESQLGSAG